MNSYVVERFARERHAELEREAHRNALVALTKGVSRAGSVSPRSRVARIVAALFDRTLLDASAGRPDELIGRRTQDQSPIEVM